MPTRHPICCFQKYSYLCTMKLPKSRQNKLGLNDKIAIQLAKEYNLDTEYIKCRRMGMSIADSLEEWDLLDMQKIHIMINQAQN